MEPIPKIILVSLAATVLTLGGYYVNNDPDVCKDAEVIHEYKDGRLCGTVQNIELQKEAFKEGLINGETSFLETDKEGVQIKKNIDDMMPNLIILIRNDEEFEDEMAGLFKGKYYEDTKLFDGSILGYVSALEEIVHKRVEEGLVLQGEGINERIFNAIK